MYTHRQTSEPGAEIRTSVPAAFTLVELLVVITIIGILIALLLPAVQAARESARRIQCGNNLKQLALGCIAHESAHGFLPSAGWGWKWSGDPDRGFDKRQPGGWLFSILPYIEQQPLYDLGLGDNASGRTTTASTVVPTFYCPTRRTPIAYPASTTFSFHNITPSVLGRNDYAGCVGGTNYGTMGSGPGSPDDGNTWSEQYWLDNYGGLIGNASGVILRRGGCGLAQVIDGTSNTYMIGEKYLSSDFYFYPDSYDDQGWATGYDSGVVRFTDITDEAQPVDPPPEACMPAQDQPGSEQHYKFGSAHAASFNMAFCDGAVHAIGYTIDAEVHRRLGSRKDGLPIDGKTF